MINGIWKSYQPSSDIFWRDLAGSATANATRQTKSKKLSFTIFAFYAKNALCMQWLWFYIFLFQDNLCIIRLSWDKAYVCSQTIFFKIMLPCLSITRENNQGGTIFLKQHKKRLTRWELGLTVWSCNRWGSTNGMWALKNDLHGLRRSAWKQKWFF